MVIYAYPGDVIFAEPGNCTPPQAHPILPQHEGIPLRTMARYAQPGDVVVFLEKGQTDPTLTPGVPTGPGVEVIERSDK